MIHRHLDYDASTPVAARGPAALDDVLQRGDLADWTPLLHAVAADPHGRLADQIVDLVDQHQAYGTARLWRTWIARLRGRTSAATVPLAELRRRRGLHQREVATAMGIAQPDVSKLEARGDARVSTLRAYVAATGGTLRLIAHYPDEVAEARLAGASPNSEAPRVRVVEKRAVLGDQVPPVLDRRGVDQPVGRVPRKRGRQRDRGVGDRGSDRDRSHLPSELLEP